MYLKIMIFETIKILLKNIGMRFINLKKRKKKALNFALEGIIKEEEFK